MNFDTLQAEVLPRTVRMKKEMLKRLLVRNLTCHAVPNPGLPREAKAMTEKVERHTKRDSVATGVDKSCVHVPCLRTGAELLMLSH
eukprot:6320928-Amphidinium_carterae.1